MIAEPLQQKNQIDTITTAPPIAEGVVFKKTIGTYFVHVDGRVVPCSISTKLRRTLLYPTADPSSIRPHVVGVAEIQVVDPVAVGDHVRYIDPGDGSGMIVEVVDRRSRLSRRSAVPQAGSHTFEQVIVANLDQVIAVFPAANPPPNWNLLDRYLASAESLNLQALVCITKIDLLTDRRPLLETLQEYRSIGYPFVLTSSVSGEGLEELRQALQGKLSVLIGKSGVGKSTLLNAIQPGLGLKVTDINSKTGKGRHTTTNLEMFALGFGGCLVDTPGMREFGLWDVGDIDLAELFPEMRPYLGKCRFGVGCSHTSEPGCAVQKAVSRGEVSRRRYESMIKLKDG